MAEKKSSVWAGISDLRFRANQAVLGNKAFVDVYTELTGKAPKPRSASKFLRGKGIVREKGMAALIARNKSEE